MANTCGLHFNKIGGIWTLRVGRKPLFGLVAFELWCSFSNSGELFQSKVMCENFAWIGCNRRYVNIQGGRSPYQVFTCACDAHFQTWQSYSSQKSCVSLSRVIVSTHKNKYENKNKTSKAARLWSTGWKLTIIESIWKPGNLPHLVANIGYMIYISSKSEVFDFSGRQKPLLGGLQ